MKGVKVMYDELNGVPQNIQDVAADPLFWANGDASEARDVRPKSGVLPPLLIGGINVQPLDGPDPVFSADWLSATLKSEGLTQVIDLDWFYRVLYRRFDCLHRKEFKVRSANGRNGYEKSIRFFVSGEDAGGIFYGGKHQRNTVFFEVKGSLCGLIKPLYWYWIFRVFRMYGARVTRFDLAADFFRGECSVRHLNSAWEESPRAILGGNGKLPAGKWVDGKEKGSSLTIGGRESNRQICVYEKGKELGDSESPWVRLELRFRAFTAEIVYDALNPERWLDYLRGSGPYFEPLFPAGGFLKMKQARPAEFETMLKAVIAGLVHCSKQYGRLLFWAGNMLGPVNAWRLLARNDGTWSKIKKYPRLTSDEAMEMMNVILSKLVSENSLPAEFQPLVESDVPW